MTPAFLGIGVPRGGTTWLHELLNSHPDVAMPTRRKVVHFFDRDYDRGQQWYESFFPSDEHPFQAVGEITPHYLYDERCPQRIARVESIRKILLILRNPIDRAFSHSVYRMRQDNFHGNFEDFLQARPQALEWGRYATHIRRYLDHFPREHMLILVHEHVFEDIDTAKTLIANAVGVDGTRFPDRAGLERINAVVLPRHRHLASWSSKVGASLRRRNLDWIPNLLGRRLGVKRLFGRSSAPKPTLDPDFRSRLLASLLDEIEAVEQLISVNLSAWKPDAIHPHHDGKDT